MAFDETLLEKVNIRSFDREKDQWRVEELEKMCEVGSRKSHCLFIDMLGDPLCRIRNSPLYQMLVAELREELIGVVRGSIKAVSTGNPAIDQAKVGYILGLRVSPLYRRRGIGSGLTSKMEDWFIANDVDYAYMATEKKNKASIKLFVDKLGYSKFRSPTILVNPVGQREIHIPSSIEIKKLNTVQAEHLLRKFMGSTEFFPQDIDQILLNKLSLGTWIAVIRGEPNPSSWAMVSVWNSGDLFKLRVCNVPPACVLLSKSSRLISRFLPCLPIPMMPDLFTSFGFYFMYGIHGDGPQAMELVRALCQHVHNLATMREDNKLVAAEIGDSDVLRNHIPHWKCLSCSEDLWCMKTVRKNAESSNFDWTKAQSPKTLFVDPREV